MHSYLKSIGFSKINQRKLDELLREVVKEYDEKYLAKIEDDRHFLEVTKMFGDSIGISVCGYYDEDSKFRIEYYYPFFYGQGITTHEKVFIEKHSDKDSYAGACDDVRVGITLIFYLQKPGEYLKKNKEIKEIAEIPVTLSGLADNGKIILPVKKDKELVKIDQENSLERNNLLTAAREGDEEAIENLTMEEMNIYSSITHRIESEDIMTIVDSYIMPYGIECDRYSVMGEIKECKSIKNNVTQEMLYEMAIEAHDILFDIVINESDLLGIPEVGRRFKGEIWLQGELNYY